MRVLVTGAAGYFGRQILPELCADARIERIVGLDRLPVAFAHPKLTSVVRDLEAPGIEALLEGIDAVIHLAFRVERLPGETIEGTNLGANARFLEAAAMAVDTLVVASSVAAYGFREAPFDKLGEDAPIAPARGFYYAEHKIAGERVLDAIEPGARARIVRARPSMVGGPTVDPRRAIQYQGRFQLIPHTRAPLRVQLLHEADLGPAFHRLLDAPAGAYNVAPDDALFQVEAARLVGQVPLVAPVWLVSAACRLAWRAGLSSLDPAWVHVAAYPTPVADNRKLKALGWTPRYTTRETLLDTARARRNAP